MKRYKVAVVGVGAVGIEMVRCLKQRNFPLKELRLCARSARAIDIDGVSYQVEAITPEVFSGIDIALFAGTEGAKGAAVQYAPEAVKQGAVVIDNGADFRLKDDVPLIVPEVNKEAISQHKGIIANPNCTTIQMVTALAQIQRHFGLSQVILTSFQATSGGGRQAAQTLWDETAKLVSSNSSIEAYTAVNRKLAGSFDVFGRQIICNVVPKIGGFGEHGYTSEEQKTIHETHKIFNDSAIKITSTCVRVPVFTAHSESIYFVTAQQALLSEIKKALTESEGVRFFADDAKFPVPLDAESGDDVLVGRVRVDPAVCNAFWLWCVADNLRKGAALNAVQIAEHVTLSL